MAERPGRSTCPVTALIKHVDYFNWKQASLPTGRLIVTNRLSLSTQLPVVN
jgi:hypothetical protein